MPPKKKSPKSSHRKEMISDRLETSRRLYLRPNEVPKNINHFFKRLSELTPTHYIVHLDLSNRNLQNIDIKHYFRLDSFKTLENLNCSNTQLTTLNVGYLENLKVLKCSNNLLTNKNTYLDLFLTKNTKLEVLDCSSNKFIYLNVNNNPLLLTLFCSNNQLDNLNLLKNTRLSYLDCNSNKLSNINVENTHLLKTLLCLGNKLDNLNLLKNTSLEELECSFNKLEQLNIENSPCLKTLYCSKNKLENLNLLKNTRLSYLDCSYNKLEQLNIENSPLLKTLNCNKNHLDNLNLLKNTRLSYLKCGINHLVKITLWIAPQLSYLDCSYNKIVNLNVEKNPLLKIIECNNNRLKILDLGTNTQLSEIKCAFNRLYEIDLSAIPGLSYLDCGYNQLIHLDITMNTRLETLLCPENYLKEVFINYNPHIKTINVVNNIISVPTLIAKTGSIIKSLTNTNAVSQYYVEYDGIKDHDLNKLLYNFKWKLFDRSKMLKFPKDSIIPQKLINCNNISQLSTEHKTYIIKSHGILLDTKYLLPKDVFVITMSLAGDVVALSREVGRKLVDFYMKPSYTIKIPYICKKSSFNNIDDIVYFLSTLSSDIESKEYVTLIPTLRDLDNYYKKQIVSKNMLDLIKFGWEFTQEYNYLFKKQDQSKMKTPENIKLATELNAIFEKPLARWSQEEGRKPHNKINYNIRNHLEKTYIHDQLLSFYMESCSTEVCSIDTIVENLEGRTAYKGCHQFGTMELSEFIKMHGKGIYIINACRCMGGVRHINIDKSIVRTESLEYDCQ
uniref:Uncharacterized protein n=1 Tax=viral metagenome TaxID=1070528 RepID=A0A6C0EL56_9ZZZZ